MIFFPIGIIGRISSSDITDERSLAIDGNAHQYKLTCMGRRLKPESDMIGKCFFYRMRSFILTPMQGYNLQKLYILVTVSRENRVSIMWSGEKCKGESW